MATLKEFLQTGQLGPIYPGMRQAEVITLFGPPQDVSVERHPKILKYGGLQLTFLRAAGGKDQTLAHIGLYYSGPSAEPVPALTLPADFQGTPESTVTEVYDFLARVGLHASAIVEDEETNYLVLPSGARITFDGQKLQKINFAAQAANPTKKQISVSISKEAWNALRRQARHSNRSISEMCAEWIMQRAKELQQDNAVAVGNPG